jgi:hypothetical protein
MEVKSPLTTKRQRANHAGLNDYGLWIGLFVGGVARIATAIVLLHLLFELPPLSFLVTECLRQGTDQGHLFPADIEKVIGHDLHLLSLVDL